ncbi:serine/threonine/dual specificity protein kinase, catalytic domain-containing protein [Artemisia annua]|uniref:Serine/threonine/dual specificity protein kinase, catalytic domain-containing protein n=1 Tax=Artemisia annua TaxID=35608 RepID=A0A2U1M0F2_ARTAN|nr:serine/threonine/dual specificity protein kinase, catalytic domain-containing protein [Artemisia annua]
MASFNMNELEHLQIPLKDILSATNNFHKQNYLGGGEFGNGKVYKGELLLSEGLTMVTLKRLDRLLYGQGESEFFEEIRMLSQYKHVNLISLLGFCIEGREMILVYEYASKGSLDRWLTRPDQLSWNKRLHICIGAARGLSFLHYPGDDGTLQTLLHRHIQSANILLDQNWNAKIVDNGLSKMDPLGTPGYADPLYIETGIVTKESDVYSFGVVLFELLCGRLCKEYSNGQLNVFVPYWKKAYEENKLEEIIFKDTLQQISPGCLERFSRVAYQCLHEDREERPPMALILTELKIALELQKKV